jgi:hypothetical protein
VFVLRVVVVFGARSEFQVLSAMALPALMPESPTATTAAVRRYFMVVLH